MKRHSQVKVNGQLFPKWLKALQNFPSTIIENILMKGILDNISLYRVILSKVTIRLNMEPALIVSLSVKLTNILPSLTSFLLNYAFCYFLVVVVLVNVGIYSCSLPLQLIRAMVEPGLAEILAVVEFSLKACVMTVDLTRKITLHQNLLHMLHILHRIRDFKRRKNLISSRRHARGEKRGVKRDRSVSSSVGSSTTPPSAKAKKIKDPPRVSKHFKLHRKAFMKCEHNRPVSSAESTTFGLKSKRLSQMCSTGSSKRSSGSGTMLEELCSTATMLAVLFNEDKITLDEVTHVVDKFRDDHGIRILWLKMSPENKIKYVKDLR